MHFDYLIIGGNIAGMRAAEAIRARDVSGTIAMVCDEPHRPYSRVLLPHFVRGKVPRERLFLVPETWYATNDIASFLGVSVARVDPAVQRVEFSDERIVTYGKLLVASGCSARPFSIPGVPTLLFRTLADAERIRNMLDEISALPEPERRVAVFGSGFIAFEFLDLFTERGFATHLYHRGTRFMERFLAPQASRVLEEAFQAKGIVLHPGTTEAMLPSALPSGCRALGVGIGIDPARSFLGEETGALRCTDRMETQFPNVWAAGDVAECYDVYAARHRSIRNYAVADQGGRIAGANMAGDAKAFRAVSYYAAHVVGIPVSFIGDADPSSADRMEASEERGGIVQRLYRGGRLIGAIAVGTVGVPLQREVASAAETASSVSL